MFGRWKRRREEHRADKQQGDPQALEREGDPRGGLQDEEYRTADARDRRLERCAVRDRDEAADVVAERRPQRRDRDDLARDPGELDAVADAVEPAGDDVEPAGRRAEG